MSNELGMKGMEAIDTEEELFMDVDISNEESSEETEDAVNGEAAIKFKVTLTDLRETQLSRPFYVRGLPWQIKLKENSTRIPKAMGFHLRCNGAPQHSAWSCFAVAELRLLKHWKKPSIYSESDDCAFTRKIRHAYNADESEAGFVAFISWEDLCDPRRGFFVDNSIEVQVYVKADVPRIEYDVGPSVKVQELETGSKTIYYFDLPKVSAFCGQHLSPVFKIHNKEFQLILKTVPKDKPTAIGVFLICLGDPKHPLWSCYVEAKLRLMNQNSRDEFRTRTLKHLFSKDEACCGFRRFLSWKHFVDGSNGFIKNDTVYFKVEVKRDASAVSKMQFFESKESRARREAKMRCTVYNVSQLKNTLFTSPFYACNLPWRVNIMQRICIGPTRHIQRYLSVYLECNEESEAAWRCNVLAAFTLSKRGEECGRGLHYVFSKEKKCTGFSHFIPWNKVLDPGKGFIKDDSITLFVYLKAEELHGVN